MTQFKVDFNDFKRRDNTNLMEITLYNDSGEQITPNRDHQWSGKALKFGDGDKRLDQELAVTLDGDKIGVPSKQFENLPAGDYGLELWEVNNDSKTIYPSAGFIEFHIHRNADESLESVTPTTDINKVIDDLHQAGLNMVVDGIEMLAPDATPSVTSEFRDGKNHIKLHVPRGLKGDQGPQGPTGSVDNDGLTNAPAFKALQTQVNDSAVGINLFSQSTATPGYVNLANGTVDIADADNEKISDYIPVSANSAYTFQLWGTTPSGKYGFGGIGEYDSNKKFILRDTLYGNATVSSDTVEHLSKTITTTSTTAFVRVSFSKYNDYKAKFEKGSVATPWTPNPTENATVTSVAALQTQVNNSAVGTNLIVQSDLKLGYIRNDGGVAISGYDFHSDNYIATNGATVFTFSSPDYAFKGNSQCALAMYDTDKNCIGYQFITSPTQTLSKPNAVYIRFSINFSNEGGTVNKLSDWLANHRYKLEKGSVATDWSLNPSEILTQTDYAKIQAAIVALGGSLK